MGGSCVGHRGRCLPHDLAVRPKQERSGILNRKSRAHDATEALPDHGQHPQAWASFHLPQEETPPVGQEAADMTSFGDAVMALSGLHVADGTTKATLCLVVVCPLMWKKSGAGVLGIGDVLHMRTTTLKKKEHRSISWPLCGSDFSSFGSKMESENAIFFEWRRAQYVHGQSPRSIPILQCRASS